MMKLHANIYYLLGLKCPKWGATKFTFSIMQYRELAKYFQVTHAKAEIPRVKITGYQITYAKHLILINMFVFKSIILCLRQNNLQWFKQKF